MPSCQVSLFYHFGDLTFSKAWVWFVESSLKSWGPEVEIQNGFHRELTGRRMHKQARASENCSE